MAVCIDAIDSPVSLKICARASGLIKKKKNGQTLNFDMLKNDSHSTSKSGIKVKLPAL